MRTSWAAVRIPSLTARRLVILWVISLFLVWVVLVTGWYVAERRLSALGSRLFQDIITLNTVRDLELAVLGYTREELLWHATYSSEHQPHSAGAHEEHGSHESHGHLADKHQQRNSCLDAIDAEVKRLRGIVRDLTDDIQVASGAFRVRKTQVELTALVRHLVHTLADAIAGHAIDLETSGECLVLGDPERIERVLQNLVSNAVKYSPAGTRVTVRIEKGPQFAVLSVSDEGPGIGEEDLRVLFQPFGRGRSADAFAEGTGMGLYIVKRIIEAHDGRIEVQSEFGRGTTFRISLPLA
jgi:signal transduction histidine kinase